MAIAVALIAACAAPGNPDASLITSEPSVGNACENADAGYHVTYPPDWFVHPPDEETGVSPCTYFGPGPFELVTNDAGRLIGYSISISDIDTCVESGLIPPAASLDTTIDGFPARVEDYSDSDRGEYLYIIDLRPDIEPCEAGRSRFLVLATDALAPGGYATNRRALDGMAASIDITSD